MKTAQRHEIPGKVYQSFGSPIVVRNDGLRAVEVIGDLTGERVRLLPGEVLEVDLSPTRGRPEITLYEGGLQIEYAPTLQGAPGGIDRSPE